MYDVHSYWNRPISNIKIDFHHILIHGLWTKVWPLLKSELEKNTCLCVCVCVCVWGGGGGGGGGHFHHHQIGLTESFSTHVILDCPMNGLKLKEKHHHHDGFQSVEICISLCLLQSYISRGSDLKCGPSNKISTSDHK